MSMARLTVWTMMGLQNFLTIDAEKRRTWSLCLIRFCPRESLTEKLAVTDLLLNSITAFAFWGTIVTVRIHMYNVCDSEVVFQGQMHTLRNRLQQAAKGLFVSLINQAG